MSLLAVGFVVLPFFTWGITSELCGAGVRTNEQLADICKLLSKNAPCNGNTGSAWCLSEITKHLKHSVIWFNFRIKSRCVAS